MANSYSKIYIHAIFCVKNREGFITKRMKSEVEKYMCGIVNNLGDGTKLLAVYCRPDHTHILISLKPTVTISEMMRNIKANSARFINEKGWSKYKFSWQEGFGAFSVSHGHLDMVVNYILNQGEHHRKKMFREEYLDLLKSNEIEYKEKYLFDFHVGDSAPTGL